MMVLCFSAMTLALAALQGGRRGAAVAAFALGLALSAGLFLYEIDSPTDGFRMPWLRG
jgi:hypothetical protein